MVKATARGAMARDREARRKRLAAEEAERKREEEERQQDEREEEDEDAGDVPVTPGRGIFPSSSLSNISSDSDAWSSDDDDGKRKRKSKFLLWHPFFPFSPCAKLGTILTFSPLFAHVVTWMRTPFSAAPTAGGGGGGDNIGEVVCPGWFRVHFNIVN